MQIEKDFRENNIFIGTLEIYEGFTGENMIGIFKVEEVNLTNSEKSEDNIYKIAMPEISEGLVMK
jgi:hypothetical protein